MNENIEIEVDLGSKYWDDRVPQAMVYFDDVLIFEGQVADDVTVKYSADLAEDTQHTIAVELINKQDSDTVQDDDGAIIRDVLLTIRSVRFDGIELGYLPYREGQFFPNQTNLYAPRGIVKNCLDFGWNGRWELKFTSPAYLWLLENL